MTESGIKKLIQYLERRLPSAIDVSESNQMKARIRDLRAKLVHAHNKSEGR